MNQFRYVVALTNDQDNPLVAIKVESQSIFDLRMAKHHLTNGYFDCRCKNGKWLNRSDQPISFFELIRIEKAAVLYRNQFITNDDQILKKLAMLIVLDKRPNSKNILACMNKCPMVKLKFKLQLLTGKLFKVVSSSTYAKALT